MIEWQSSPAESISHMTDQRMSVHDLHFKGVWNTMISASKSKLLHFLLFLTDKITLRLFLLFYYITIKTIKNMINFYTYIFSYIFLIYYTSNIENRTDKSDFCGI